MKPVKEQVSDQVRGQVRDQVLSQVSDQVWNQVRVQVRNQVSGKSGIKSGKISDEARVDEIYLSAYGNLNIKWIKVDPRSALHDMIVARLESGRWEVLVRKDYR